MIYARRGARRSMAVGAFLLVAAGLACHDPVGVVDGSADLEAAWSVVDSVYPYLEFKRIDWDAVHSIYSPRFQEAFGNERHVVLLEMLGELRDGHVKFTPPAGARISLQEGWVEESDGAIVPYIGPRWWRDSDVWTADLLLNYLHPDSIHISGDSLIGYAIRNDGIGYVRVSEFMPHEITRDFDAALSYLRNTRALIVDVRHNTGGNHDTIREFVGRFLTEPLDAIDVYILGELDPLGPVLPRGPFQYKNPVVVLINGRSFSGAEAFAEMMKQVPQVTAVGDTTGGGSGAAADRAPGTFRLPSGAEMKIPTGDARRYDGLPWEWLGIAPDIRVEQTEVDRANGRDMQLEYAVEFLDQRT
ncbi:MAG TPA: S41 family peptidase [Gemmatimonadota bacterium]|nr:S41 family peptidase [Gemmatimonadota bacterium]